MRAQPRTSAGLAFRGETARDPISAATLSLSVRRSKYGQRATYHKQGSGGERRSRPVRKAPPAAQQAQEEHPGSDTDAEPSLYFSRRARATEYKPKTLSDYKAAYGDSKYMELGRLGGDTESDEVVAKRQARKRMQAYGAALTAENAALLAQRKAKAGQAPASLADPDEAAAAARAEELAKAAEGLNKAKEYAAKVKKRNRKKLASAGGSGGRERPDVSVDSHIVALAEGRPTGGPRKPSTVQAARSEAKAYAAHKSELDRLLANHDKLRKDVERIRSELPPSARK